LFTTHIMLHIVGHHVRHSIACEQECTTNVATTIESALTLMTEDSHSFDDDHQHLLPAFIQRTTPHSPCSPINYSYTPSHALCHLIIISKLPSFYHQHTCIIHVRPHASFTPRRTQYSSIVIESHRKNQPSLSSPRTHSINHFSQPHSLSRPPPTPPTIKPRLLTNTAHLMHLTSPPSTHPPRTQ